MPHEKLEAWHRCHELVLAVYAGTRGWPRDELYGLTSQARRAAVSAASNIVEGAAKKGSREFRRYLDISLGSLAELGYLLRLATELKFLSPEVADHLVALHARASQVTWKYAALKRA